MTSSSLHASLTLVPGILAAGIDDVTRGVQTRGKIQVFSRPCFYSVKLNVHEMVSC